MPRQIVRLVLAVLILASLFGGRSLVANLADGAQHVVKPGETLSGIAAQYGVTVEQLSGLNGITDPDRLAEGQALKLPATARVPGGPPPASQPSAQAGSPAANPATGSQQQQQAQASPKPTGGTEYVVQPGDTLSGIAKSLGVSMKALLEANELADPDRLKVGQKLAVPGRRDRPGGGRIDGALQSARVSDREPGRRLDREPARQRERAGQQQAQQSPAPTRRRMSWVPPWIS